MTADRNRRIRISGRLVTRSPMHIGSGEELYVKMPGPDADEYAAVDAICSDDGGRPYIPGASLRGCLRAWMTGAGADEKIIREIWGTGDKDNERGGRVYVRGGLFNKAASRKPAWPERRPEPARRHYWNPDRWTGIENGVAINRFTRTASHHRLFYYEAVPPGAVFDVHIDCDGLTDEELGWIMAALKSFNTPLSDCRLGAGRSAGYGRCEWDEQKMKLTGLLTKEDRIHWLVKSRSCGFNGFPALDDDVKKGFETAVSPPEAKTMAAVTVEIDFDGPMLVNDTSGYHEHQRPDSAKDSDGERPAWPDHTYLTDHQNRVALPPRSVRGALRSHAERILRTMAETICGGRLSPKGLKKAACYPDDPAPACKNITRPEQTGDLCFACGLFGAPGLRSPFWVGEFRAVDEGEELIQEFVAVDRFTGGAAHQKKFDAVSRFGPTFRGTLAVELSDDTKAAARLGLLCLVVRDLCEGDIRFGFGSSKGYGACTARIADIHIPAEITGVSLPGSLKPGMIEHADLPGGSAPEIREIQVRLVRSLEKQLKNILPEVCCD